MKDEELPVKFNTTRSKIEKYLDKFKTPAKSRPSNDNSEQAKQDFFDSVDHSGNDGAVTFTHEQIAGF